MKHYKTLFAGLLVMAQNSAVFAHQFDSNNLYGGAGLAFNSIGAGNATGFQLFAGYDLNVTINDDIHTAVEIGYMDSGDFSAFGGGNTNGAQGVWTAVVADTPINQKLDARMRIGLDFGDDDGVLVGAGFGYHFTQQTEMRIDYVVRDSINGLQFNLLFHL